MSKEHDMTFRSTVRTTSRTLALATVLAVAWLTALATSASAKVAPEPAYLPPAPGPAIPEATSITPYLITAGLAALVAVAITLAVQTMVRDAHGRRTAAAHA
jgi:hypothetical protein